MKLKIICSIVITLAFAIAQGFYATLSPATDAAMAAQQANNSTAIFAATTAGIAIHKAMWWVFFGALALIWLPALFSKTKTPILVSGLAICLAGCGPARYDKFAEIGPNETAFVIPLTGDSVGNQVKFNSVEFLDAKKVSAKRIAVPLMRKSTGRMWFSYEWIDTIVIFKVDRGLVSREWTDREGTGTSTKDEGIPVVTKDGIKLTVGCAVTTYIEESDAATYLYYHGLQKLSEVTDNNIRNFCISELTREYGQLDLSDAKTKGPEVFGKLFKDAAAYFKTKGITISQLGNAEGFDFKDPSIQKSINQRFIAEQDIQTAAQEKLAQDKRNEKLIATAQTERDAAKMLFEAKEAATLKNQLEIQMTQAKAALTMAEKWNGQLPASILPANSPLLLNLNGSNTTK